MFPVFQVGPLSIQSNGLILLAGLWLALTLVERYAHLLGAEAEDLSNLTFYSVLGAILGSRIFYVLRFPSTFAEHPSNLFSLNPGLLDPVGGLLAAILVAVIFGQRKKLELLTTLDALTPGLAMMSGAMALSQLATGSAYGLPTSLPWAIDLWGASRHPSQIYSLLATGLIFYLIVRKLMTTKPPAGQLFLSFTALSALARLFLDAFRGDQLALLLGMRSSQLAAWVVLAASLFFIYRRLPEVGENA